MIVAGTLDTKGAELRFMRDCLRERGLTVVLVDLSTLEPATGGDVSVSARQIAACHPDGADAVKSGLQFDPQGRAVPFDTGYISLVYDGTKIEQAPTTFEDLLKSRYEGDLIVQNAQQSDPGRAFLLWTIHEFGADGYLDYWTRLLENDVKILGDWSTAYNAYMGGEAPMVVSYSTDQVYYADQEDVTWDKHTIGFLNDQGYANPEAMARFADAPNADLAADFMDFVLSKEAQSVVPERNVQFPATTYDGILSETFQQYAKRPPEPVTFTYEDLAGNVNEWVDTWAKEIASK